MMFTPLINLLILTLLPTEITATAATPNGGEKEIRITAPADMENPIGTIVPETGEPSVTAEPLPEQLPSVPPTCPPCRVPQLIYSQTSTTDPQAMNQNPVYYENRIENTIYQDGDRLIIIQAVPISAVKTALTPNIQPTISDYPAF